MSEEYDIGYGKPPKHTQFKKGQSGNRKGRPKGSKNLRTIVQERMNEPVAVKQNGRRKKVSMMEAIIAGLISDAAKGDARARKELIDLTKMYCVDEVHQADSDAIGSDDQSILDVFLNRKQRQSETPAPRSNGVAGADDSEDDDDARLR